MVVILKSLPQFFFFLVDFADTNFSLYSWTLVAIILITELCCYGEFCCILSGLVVIFCLQELHGRNIRVSFANDKPSGGFRSGYGGGGGGGSGSFGGGGGRYSGQGDF